MISVSTRFEEFADIALSGEALSHEQAQQVLATPDDDLEFLLNATRRVRAEYFGNRVKVCVLLNAQSGICPEDCSYCSQSKISKADVDKYKLLPQEQIIERAQTAAASGAKRFCIVIAARGPRDKDIEHIGEAVSKIKSDVKTAHLEICTSLGLMNQKQCADLKGYGVDYVNHNLNTSEKHYANICRTHTYADRVSTLHNIQSAGLKTCSGGIVGMGEGDDDLIEMGFALRALNIESIPVNFLLTIPGTLLEKEQAITASRGLKVLCLMRLLNPDKEVRVAAGRETHLKHEQAKALYAANSLFVDGYLTTPGEAHERVKTWIEAAGFEVES